MKLELMVECVGAHDLCYGGVSAPCPWCEPVYPPRTVDGKFVAFEPTSRNFKDLQDDVKNLSDALRLLMNVVNQAGVFNLSHGVQLGQVAWCVKMQDAMNYAEQVLQDLVDVDSDGRR